MEYNQPSAYIKDLNFGDDAKSKYGLGTTGFAKFKKAAEKYNDTKKK